MINIVTLSMLAATHGGPATPVLPHPPTTPDFVSGPCVDSAWLLEVVPTFGDPIYASDGTLLTGHATVQVSCENALPSGHGYAGDVLPGAVRAGASHTGTVTVRLAYLGGNEEQQNLAWIQAATRPATKIDASVNPPAGFTANPEMSMTFDGCDGANNRVDVSLNVASNGTTVTGSVEVGPTGVPTVGVGVGGASDISSVPKARWFNSNRRHDSKRLRAELVTLEGCIYMEAVADGWHAGAFFNVGDVSIEVADSTYNSLLRFGSPGCVEVVSSKEHQVVEPGEEDPEGRRQTHKTIYHSGISGIIQLN